MKGKETMNRYNEDSFGGRDYDEREGCLISLIASTVSFFIIILFLCLCLASCAPRVIERNVVRHDTCYIQKTQRDSIYLHDSIHIAEKQQGETIRITTDRWHTAYRDRIVRDTTYIAKTDTVKATDVREVQKKLSWWQRAQINIGRLFIIIGFFVLFFRFTRSVKIW